MKITTENLIDKKQTGKKMHFLINKYYHDLKNIKITKNGKKVPVLSLSLQDFFNIVKKIKYKKDNRPVEVISRPKYIFNKSLSGADCKKKSIIISSFLKNKNIPYRLIASSNQPNKRIHHVFPQAKISGRWMNVDATYPEDKIFESKLVTAYEVLK